MGLTNPSKHVRTAAQKFYANCPEFNCLKRSTVTAWFKFFCTYVIIRTASYIHQISPPNLVGNLVVRWDWSPPAILTLLGIPWSYTTTSNTRKALPSLYPVNPSEFSAGKQHFQIRQYIQCHLAVQTLNTIFELWRGCRSLNLARESWQMKIWYWGGLRLLGLPELLHHQSGFPLYCHLKLGQDEDKTRAR